MRIRSGDLGVEAANREERAISARILVGAAAIMASLTGVLICADTKGNDEPMPSVTTVLDTTVRIIQD